MTKQTSEPSIIVQTHVGDTLVELLRFGVYLVIFLPLYVNQNFLFPFVAPRTLIFRTVVMIMAALWISLVVLNPSFRPKLTIPTVLMLPFVSVLTVSALLGANPYHSFWSSIERSEGVITWLSLALFFIIINQTFRNKNDWISFLKTMMMAGLLQTLYALTQAINWSSSFGLGERLSGTIGNASFLAAYVLLAMGAGATLLTQKVSRLIKGSAAILIILGSAVIWQTQTRGAVLALIGGILLYATIALWTNKKSWGKAIVGLLILMSILSGGLLVAYQDTPVIKENATLRRLAKISPTDITTQNRLIVWGAGLQGFLERPLLGFGPENFSLVFNRHFDPRIARDVGSRPWYDRAHNVIVELAATSGILGLGVYLALIAWALYQSAMIFKKTNRHLGIILLALLAAYFFQNLFVFDTINSYLMFILILGLIQVFSTKESPEKTAKKMPTLRFSQTREIVIPVIAVILVLPIVYLTNVRPALANYYTVEAIIKHKTDVASMQQAFKRAFKYSPPDDYELRFILIQHTRDQVSLRGTNEETAPLVDFAISEMEKSITAAPDQIQNYLLLGELFLATTDLDPTHLTKAKDITALALARAPQRYQVYTLLGRIRLSSGQFSQGIDDFKQAITLNPKQAESHWNLAIAYILTNQHDLVFEELDATYHLGFDIYTEANMIKLLNAYKDSKNLKATTAFLETSAQQVAALAQKSQEQGLVLKAHDLILLEQNLRQELEQLTALEISPQ